MIQLKKLNFIAIGFGFLLSLSALAQPYQPSLSDLTLPPMARKAVDKDKKLNIELKRPVVILEDSSWTQKFPQDSQTLLVANIFHNKKFYIAQVPLDSVQRIRFLNEPFGGVLSHTMIRYTFHDQRPIRLLAEIPTHAEAQSGKDLNVLNEPILLQDIISSLEVVAPEGDSGFSPMKGLSDHYQLAVRMVSLTGRNVKAYLEYRDKVYQTDLNYTPEEAQKSFVTALNLSHDLGLNTTYNTLTNNCNVISFQILRKGRRFTHEKQSFCEKAVGFSRKVLEKVFPFFRWHPPLANFILKVRGYNSVENTSSLLNDDPAFLELAKTHPAYADCSKNLKSETP